MPETHCLVGARCVAVLFRSRCGECPLNGGAVVDLSMTRADTDALTDRDTKDDRKMADRNIRDRLGPKRPREGNFYWFGRPSLDHVGSVSLTSDFVSSMFRADVTKRTLIMLEQGC